MLGACVLLVAAIGLFQQCGSKTKGKPDGYANNNNSDSCGCESSWFPHTSTPAPAEGVGSPFDTSSTTNCIFHQWSWQKFLWLTKPTPGGGVLFMDSLTLVDPYMQPVLPVEGIQLVLEDTAQAGSGGTLYSNPGFSGNDTSYLVHYSIHASQVLLDTAAAYKQLILADTNLLNNQYTFPVGSLELKVSWIDARAIPESQRSSYFVVNAVIKKGNSYTPTRVAMLGMHIVGRVINHPEFIWATFEHHDMGPYYDWSKTTGEANTPITSADDKLLFKKGSTNSIAGIYWGTDAPDSMYRVYTVFKYGVPRAARDSFMTGTSQSEPLNFNNIDGLNNCVASNLQDVWKNYFYNGSIWINTDGMTPAQQALLVDTLGNNIGNATAGSSARGSLNAFNITMETYVQTFGSSLDSIHVGNLANCFSCHASPTTSITQNHSLHTSPLYVSHIFRNYMRQTGKSTLLDAKQNGVRDFLRVQKLMLEKDE